MTFLIVSIIGHPVHFYAQKKVATSISVAATPQLYITRNYCLPDTDTSREIFDTRP